MKGKMKPFLSMGLLGMGCLLSSLAAGQEVVKKAMPAEAAQAAGSSSQEPVPFPPLNHFAKLWERSIFTTRDLPSPDAPAGPGFTEQLSLAGIYEVDGAVVAVLVDRTTSLISEARIGSENEMGIKIRKVAPGSTMDKTRIQLQKGDQAGWVSFSEMVDAPPSPAPAANGLPTRSIPPGAGKLPQRQVMPAGMPANVAPPVMPPPAPPMAGGEAPARSDDVPLPPP